LSQSTVGWAFGIKAVVEILLNATAWALVLVAALSGRRMLGDRSEQEVIGQVRIGRILRRRYWIAFGFMILIEALALIMYAGWRPPWLFIFVVFSTVVMPAFLTIFLRASRLILHYPLGKRIVLALIVLFVPFLSLVAVLMVDLKISRACRAAA
jgi:hypothetical protein